MDRRWWWLAALWCAHVDAQGVHKCIAPDGAVSYRDTPCERPSRDAADWEAPQDLPPSRPVETSHAAAIRADRPRSTPGRSARSAGTHIARGAPKPSACEAAKAHRDQTLERVGLKRTFDLLSRLDEQVRNACR